MRQKLEFFSSKKKSKAFLKAGKKKTRQFFPFLAYK
jgi:hypothetical protein